MSEQKTPYQLLGEEGIRRLAFTFYEVMDECPQVKGIRNMHGENLEEVQQKLGDYLIGWMGGPPVYQARHGTVCLTDPHAPYAIGPRERDQWLLCFHEALKRIGAGDDVKEMLREPIFALASAVQNREESTVECGAPGIGSPV